MAPWVSQGPFEIREGQVENIPPDDVVIGAIHAVAPHPTNANILYIGATNGGVWRTLNATAANPGWAPLTDFHESLSIGGLHVDGSNPDVVLAGVGNFSSFGRIGGPSIGLLLTTDAGNTWGVIDDPLLTGRQISSVYVRGNLMLAGASFGGVQRSDDGGASWSSATGIFGTILDLVGDPSNTDRFYASSAGNGVYLSTDGGANWTNVSQNDVSAGGINQTITSGGNNNTELATGQDGRLYAVVMINGQAGYIGHTSDQGASWTGMDLPRVPQTTPAAVSGASNTTPIVITTAAAHGLPPNNGNLRVRITGVLGNTAANGDFAVATITAATPLNQFTLVGSAGNGAYTSGGDWQRWAQLNPRTQPGGQGGIHLSVVVDSGDSNVVYVGGDRQDLPSFVGAGDFTGNIMRGYANRAATNAIPSPQWEHTTHSDSIAAIPGGGTASSSAPHADSRDMAFDANGELIEGDDGGIYRRTSPGNNTGDWFSLNGNLAVTEFHDIAWDPISGTAIGGAQDTGNPQQTSAGSGVWNDFRTADGGDVQVDAITVAGQSIRYTSAQNLGAFTRTTFDAAGNEVAGSATAITATPPAGVTATPRFVTPFELNQLNPLRIVIAYQEAIFESTNQGANIASLGAAANANGMHYGHASNEDLLYAAAPAGLFIRTTAGGALTQSAAFPAGNPIDVVVDPADAATAYVITSGRVFITDDTGATWTEITGDLPILNPSTLRQIEYVPGATVDRIAVAADAGVYVASVNTLRFWNELGREALPNALVLDLDYDAGDDVLVAGTLGRGAWTLNAAGTIDLPPAALCQAITREANDVCLAFAQAGDFDGGSIDPEGQALAFSVSPTGPFTLGTTGVTLSVSDPPGALETCAAAITVIDVTPPKFDPVVPVELIACDPDSETITVDVPTATDNCFVPTVTGRVIASDNPALTLPIGLLNGSAIVGVGTHTIEWTATDGVGNSSTITQIMTIAPGVYATKRLDVREQAQVFTPIGNGAVLGNSGSRGTEVGIKAFVGSIVSASEVKLRDRCEVDGDVFCLDNVTLGRRVTVGDVYEKLAAIPLPGSPVPPAPTLPTGPNTNVYVKSHRTSSVAPGAYKELFAEVSSTLRLSSGVYSFRLLNFDFGSKVIIDVSAGPVFIVVSQGLGLTPYEYEIVGGGPLDVTFIYTGGKDVAVEEAFAGRIFAPEARVMLDSGKKKTKLIGQVFAREIEIDELTQFECHGDGA